MSSIPHIPPWPAPNRFTSSETGTAAQIIEGLVLPTDDFALYENIQQNKFFVDYQINNRYEKDRHLYMLPIASPNGFNGQSAAFVQLAAPTLLWICDWTVSKLGEQPEVPDPNISPGFGWILLDDFWEPATAVPASDGVTILYRLSGTFVYGKISPNPLTHRDINFGRPYWLKDALPTGRNMPDDKIKPNLSTL